MKTKETQKYEQRYSDPNNQILAGLFDESDTYYVNRPNGRRDWLLIFTMEGEGYIKTPHQVESCTSGSISFIKPSTPHQYGTAKDNRWLFYWVHFPSILFEKALLPQSELFIDVIEQKYKYNRIKEAFNRINLDFIESSMYWEELCQLGIREVLILLAQKRDSMIDVRIEEVLLYLSHHLQEKIVIKNISDRLGISTSRLSHLFKENTGYTIIEMHNQMKIRQASLLLENTNKTAQEIAYEVGYQNYNHFAKQFRKIYNQNPSSYMKSKRMVY